MLLIVKDDGEWVERIAIYAGTGGAYIDRALNFVALTFG